MRNTCPHRASGQSYQHRPKLPGSSAADQINLLIALERQASWIAYLTVCALAAAAEPPSATSVEGEPLNPFEVENPVCEEIAVALHVSSIVAEKRVRVARDLDSRMPATAAMLASGQISYAHAVVMSDECERLGDRQAREVERSVLSRSCRVTPGQLRRRAKRVALRVCPLTPEAEVDAEFAQREVRMYSDGGVMATLHAILPAPDAITVWNALTACGLADKRPGDRRTLEHRRADALTAWADRALDDPNLSRQQGRKRLETQLVLDLSTLLGFGDNPAELRGFGPIPANLARQLAVDSTWRRLVADPVSGHLLDFGSTTYTPPAALREYVLARDRRCRFPGCSQPAERTDLDHTEPFTGNDLGGSTSAKNLHCLCRRHHRLKTHHNLSVANGSDGQLTWTSPRVQTHTTDLPPALDETFNGASPRPDFTARDVDRPPEPG